MLLLISKISFSKNTLPCTIKYTETSYKITFLKYAKYGIRNAIKNEYMQYVTICTCAKKPRICKNVQINIEINMFLKKNAV